MKKRVLSLLLALAMLTALAGCGGGDAASAEDKESASEAAPAIYRLTGASEYTGGELTAQYALTYAAAGDSLPAAVRLTTPEGEHTFSYTYLADGRVLTRDMEGDEESSHTDYYYDEAGTLLWQAESICSRTYDENWEPAGWYTYGQYTDYTYDGAGQLTAAVTADSVGKPIVARAYTYTDGQRTGEKVTSYYDSYDPDTFEPVTVEDVTENTCTYDAEGWLTRTESSRDGEMSAADYTYAGALRLAAYDDGSVTAAMLAGGGEQLLGVSVSGGQGEPAIQYDGAGCLVLIGSEEGDHAAFTYESYDPVPMAGAQAPASAKMDAVMLEDACGTLALKGYMPPYVVMEFTDRCDSRAYLSVQSVALNGVGVTGFEFQTARTDPGQTTQCVLRLDSEKLARFGIGQVQTIDAYASVWQEDDEGSYSSSLEETALSAELPALTEAEEPAEAEPVFSMEPVTVADTDEYKITLADAAVEDDALRLTVQYENYTGRYMELSVRGLTVNGTALTVPEYGNTLGQSHWDSGFMEDTVGYVDEDDMFVTDLGPIIDRTGPVQSVEVTLSVYLQAEKGYEEPRLCPAVTVTF